MRQLNAQLLALLDQNVTRWAMCWRVQRSDGVALGFTSHDRPLDIDGQRYVSSPGFSPSAITASSRLDVDGLNISGALNSSAITEEDLAAGLFDEAALDIFLVDWADPSAGRIDMAAGTLGEVRYGTDAFEVECRSALQLLQTPITEAFSPECRADLGDKRCQLDLHRYTYRCSASTGGTGDVVNLAGLPADVSVFAYGRLRWLTGGNAGLDQPVLSAVGAAVTLREPPPRPVLSGDVAEIRAGCDKRLLTCRSRYANQLQFRGEPFVPGPDSMLSYPGL